jgi:predicted DNA-binding protein (MmcQ/YjbR family)
MAKGQKPKAIRSYILAKPEASASYPFGEGALVFKVANKMFALIGEDETPETINLKCDPDEALALRSAHPKTITPGYHMDKKHWNTIVLDDSLPDLLVNEMVDQSYALVVRGLPKAVREKLQKKK